MAKSMIEYLRANPEAAKATYAEAQRLLQVKHWCLTTHSCSMSHEPSVQCIAHEFMGPKRQEPDNIKEVS